MTKKEKIILLYYNENKKIVVISKELKVSKQYVSKIIKLDDRYFIEKEKRKNEAKKENSK